MALDAKTLNQLISMLEETKQVLVEERLRRRLDPVEVQSVEDEEE